MNGISYSIKITDNGARLAFNVRSRYDTSIRRKVVVAIRNSNLNLLDWIKAFPGADSLAIAKFELYANVETETAGALGHLPRFILLAFSKWRTA